MSRNEEQGDEGGGEAGLNWRRPRNEAEKMLVKMMIEQKSAALQQPWMTTRRGEVSVEKNRRWWCWSRESQTVELSRERRTDADDEVMIKKGEEDGGGFFWWRWLSWSRKEMGMMMVTEKGKWRGWLWPEAGERKENRIRGEKCLGPWFYNHKQQ